MSGYLVEDTRKVTTHRLREMKQQGKKIAMLTSYDYTMAKLVDEAGVDILSLVKEYHLPYEFPEPVIEEAKKIKPFIQEVDIKNILDLRNKEIFTIEGEDAKDLDDAVCVEKTENGTYLLGVHIADVSNYVKEASFLDKEAISVPLIASNLLVSYE